MPKELDARQLKFIESWASGMNGKDAAIAAGYSARCAKQIAWDLLNKNEVVKQYIEKLREDSIKKSGLNLETAHAKAELLMEKAIEARQHTAAARYFEFQLKLQGLLEEKYRVTHENHDIAAILAEARMRQLPPRDLSKIDDDIVDVPSEVVQTKVDDMFS